MLIQDGGNADCQNTVKSQIERKFYRFHYYEQTFTMNRFTWYTIPILIQLPYKHSCNWWWNFSEKRNSSSINKIKLRHRKYTFFTCIRIVFSCISIDAIYNIWSVYIYNIRTLSVNIKFICTSFRNRQNSETSASVSGLFRSEYKWILYLTTMYVYCVYPSM